jgi:RHS repeat-associated protein
MTPHASRACVPGPESHRLVGDPIDAVTGCCTEVVREVRLSGTLPFEWTRHYDSGRADLLFSLGWGHSHGYERQLQFDIDGMRYVGPLGHTVAFPAPQSDGAVEAAGGFSLYRVSPLRYVIRETSRPLMEFVFADPLLPASLRALRTRTGTIEFHYTSEGALERIQDGANRNILVECGERRRILRLLLLDRHSSRQRPLAAYQYDVVGNMVRATDAYGNESAFAYDSGRRLIRRTDQRGYSFHFEYDSLGRCTHSRGDDGLHEVSLDYRSGEGRTIVTQADGGAWSYEYDSERRLTAIVDPYGGVRAFQHDQQGRVVEEIDPNGDATLWVYDGSGRLIGKRSSLGHFSPDMSGPLRPDQREHRIPERPSEWEYGALLDPVASSESEAVAARLARLPLNVRRALAEAQWSEPSSPEAQRVAAGLVPGPGARPRREYDALGKLLRETDEMGRARRWSYDACGNTTRFTDFDDGFVQCEYASWDLPVRRTDASGRRVERTFTAQARVASETDPGGVSSRYVYDLKGRVAEYWYGETLLEQYRYDAADNIIAVLDGTGQAVLTREIGPGNLKVARHLTSGGTHRFEYTERGLCTRAATDDVSVEFAYDAFLNRTIDRRDGKGVEHRFIGRGLLAETTLLDRFTIRYQWLSRFELAVHDPAGGIHVLYFPGGGLVARLMSSGLCEVVQYDWEGRCLLKSSLAAAGAARKPWVRLFSHSGEGDLLSVRDSARGLRRFEYDRAHRLCREVAMSGMSASFRYDAGDNLIEQPGLSRVMVDRSNRLVSANDNQFGYDERGNLSTSQSPAGTTRYHYDSRNLLTACESARGAWRAEYDPLGRRAWKEFADEKWTYYWDTDRLAAELRPDGSLRVFVYADAFAMVPLLWLDYASPAADPRSGTRCFLLTDHLGTPVSVQDDTGTVRWSATVEPYGRCIEEGIQLVDVNLRYPGHYFDRETGLHYNRFRYYSPELGRFLQPDPLGTRDGRNPYLYTTNPLRYVDVRGDCETDGTAPTRQGTTEDGEEAAEDAVSGRWLSDDELQAAADSIHAEHENARRERSSTTTVTQGVDEDGNVRHAVTSTQPLSEDQKQRAISILGEGATLQEGGRTGRLPGNAHHGEQQGIAATEGQSDRRQASSSGAGHGGAACSHCAAAQQQAGVTNVTGVQERAGGEGRTREKMYFPDDD